MVKRNTRKDQQKQAANKKKRSLKQKQARAQYASEQAKVSASQRSGVKSQDFNHSSDKLLTGEKTIDRSIVVNMMWPFIEEIQNEVTNIRDNWSRIAFLLEVVDVDFDPYDPNSEVSMRLALNVGYTTSDSVEFTPLDVTTAIQDIAVKLVSDSMDLYRDKDYEPPRAFMGVLTQFGHVVTPVFVSEREVASGGYDKWRSDTGFTQPRIFNEILYQMHDQLPDPSALMKPYARRIHRIVEKSEKVKKYDGKFYTVVLACCSDGKTHAFSSIDGLITDWIESQIVAVFEDALRVMPIADGMQPITGLHIIMDTQKNNYRVVTLSQTKPEDQDKDEMRRKMKYFTPPNI